MFDERSNEVSQQGLSVSRASAEIAVFGRTSSHFDAVFDEVFLSLCDNGFDLAVDDVPARSKKGYTRSV